MAILTDAAFLFSATVYASALGGIDVVHHAAMRAHGFTCAP
jgi:hypothetical protein